MSAHFVCRPLRYLAAHRSTASSPRAQRGLARLRALRRAPPSTWPTNWPSAGPLLLACVAALLIGCATPGASDRLPAVGSGPQPLAPRGPGAVFPTLEAAALDALAHTHLNRRSEDEARFWLGRIQRAEGGYRYDPARPSAERVRPLRSPTLRVRLRSQDVAWYIVRTPSGSDDLDRMNEAFSRSERDAVLREDARHRPVFLLTPSLRIKVYRHETGTEPLAQVVAASDAESSRAIVLRSIGP